MEKAIATLSRRNSMLVSRTLRRTLETPAFSSLLYGFNGDSCYCSSCVSCKKYHIGIDIGTRVTGITLLEQSSNFSVQVKHCDVIQTHSHSCMNDKAREVIGVLTQLKSEHGCEDSSCNQWNIAIEECLLGFKANRFSTKGLVTLAQLNGIVNYSCETIFNSQPVSVHPTTARSLVGLKTRGTEIKPAVLEFVRNSKNKICWHVDKSNDVWSKLFLHDNYNYDRADSFVTALNSILASRRKLVSSFDLKDQVKSSCFELFEENVISSGADLKYIRNPKAYKNNKVRFVKPKCKDIEEYFNEIYEKAFRKWWRNDAEKWLEMIQAENIAQEQTY